MSLPSTESRLNGHELRCSRALYLVSRHPYLAFYRALLFQLFDFVAKKNEDAVKRLVHVMTHDLVCPSPSLSIHFALCIPPRGNIFCTWRIVDEKFNKIL
jgi:hypothetical protein